MNALVVVIHIHLEIREGTREVKVALRVYERLAIEAKLMVMRGWRRLDDRRHVDAGHDQ